MSRTRLLLAICTAGALSLPACSGRRPLLSASAPSVSAAKRAEQPLESHGPKSDPSLRPGAVEAAAALTLAAELSLGEWRPIGPWNFAGKAFDVAVSPADPNTVYAAYGFAGIWKTADGGKTWLQLNDPTDLHQFPCLTVHPRFPNVVAARPGPPHVSPLLKRTPRSPPPREPLRPGPPCFPLYLQGPALSPRRRPP